MRRSTDGGATWQEIGRIRPGSEGGAGRRYRLGIGRLGRRLVRGGIRHAVCGGSPEARTIIAVAAKRFYRMDGTVFGHTGRAAPDESVVPGAFAVGSNPLCTPAVVPAATIYYGEYRANPERSPVHVWRSDDHAATFHPAWTFADVRHVHGVFADPFDPAALWVTTGDDDSESAIWCTTDAFRTLEPMVRGGQQARAVDLIFTTDAVYFGSDTPREQNWWYRMDRRTGRVERQIPVGGSVFWARTTPDGWRVFSTVVEKSAVNKSRYAELWAAPPGNDEWRRILALKKDPFHDKYFDHGQIRFAAGPGAPGIVWITPYAVAGDQQSRIIELASRWADAPSGAVR